MVYLYISGAGLKNLCRLRLPALCRKKRRRAKIRKNYFFREEYPEKTNVKMNTIEVGGHVSGMILQNHKNSSSKPVSLTNAGAGETMETHSGLDPVMLARNLRRDSRFSAEEKLKFLDFLDEQK